MPCPAIRCQSFVRGDLNETLTAEGIWDVLTYNFVPFGNAYYPQSDCPGSKIYSRNQGVPCWQEKCGNATAQPAECFEGEPLCQHGDDECLGDRYEACASVDALAGTVSASQGAVFAYCLEAGPGGLDVAAADSCAAFAGIDPVALGACAAAGSPSGDAATAAAAKVTAEFTANYGRAWEGTPTVVLNGVVLLSTANLLAQVCAQAGGDAPAGCS